MAILDFGRRRRGGAAPGGNPVLEALLRGWSIEVTPRTAAKIERMADLLPAGTRVYVAHIEGTPFEDMVSTARRLRAEGFPVMPHVPARIVPDRATLAEWLGRYREAGVDEALVIAGGAREPVGAFESSIQLLETGLFEEAGFRRLHVAGHPEGNRDIDPDGGEANVMAALRWKQAYAERSRAEMAIVTQFAFEAAAVTAWADRLQEEGIRLPIHVGIAGPAKLQTLIRYAVACGVGPSLRVLQKRARDVTRLVLPFEPDELVADLAAHVAGHPGCLIRQLHIFPLGGIRAAAEWANSRIGATAAAAGSG